MPPTQTQTAQTQTQTAQQPSNPAPAPQLQPAQAQSAQPQQPEARTAAVPAKPRKSEYDKSLVTASIKKLPPALTPLAGCFDDAWSSFIKAYGQGAGQVMAREIDFAAQAMLNNTYLIECATRFPDHFINAIKNVALSHSTLSPVLKQGYLVPFKGKVQFMPSYMGLVEVLMKTGMVRKIEAHNVFKADDFSVSYGTDGHLVHKPDCWGERTMETFLGSYYYAVLADGSEKYEQMSKAELMAIKDRSPSTGKTDPKTGKPIPSPWDTDTLEMCRKSLLRRAFKTMPKTGVSDDNLRMLNAVFAYDMAVDDAIREETRAESKPVRNRFDEEEVEFTDLSGSPQ